MGMGCFTVLKSKKKSNQMMMARRFGHGEHVTLPFPAALTHTRSLQSPTPSFRTRTGLIHPIATNDRTRPLSPSALDATQQDASAVVEYVEQQELRQQSGLMRDRRVSSPKPLPLPCPPSGGSLKAASSFKSGMACAALCAAEPLPLPPTVSLRYFLYEEIAAACHNFSADRCMSECLSSTIYKASFGEDTPSSKKFEATVTRLHPSTQGLKEFIDEVNTLASLQHSNICRLLGFHARDGSETRMLVYERLHHGSLDRLLFGKSGGPALDWNARMKIAVCAAQGLTFLHDEGPFQAMYNEFSTANIQIDRDFSAKLSGYGCVGRIPEEAAGNLSVETLEKGMLTPKSNVWSFGIILLELLTGRKNIDSRHPSEERNLVKLTWPFLADDQRLSLIMDPQLKGCYSRKAARTIADIAQRCLQKEPSIRPNMRTVVKHLKMIQAVAIPGKQVSRSPSLIGVPCHVPRLIISPPSPPGARLHVLPSPRRAGAPTALPPLERLEELVSQEAKRSLSSVSRKASFEGC